MKYSENYGFYVIKRLKKLLEENSGSISEEMANSIINVVTMLDESNLPLFDYFRLIDGNISKKEDLSIRFSAQYNDVKDVYCFEYVLTVEGDEIVIKNTDDNYEFRFSDKKWSAKFPYDSDVITIKGEKPVEDEDSEYIDKFGGFSKITVGVYRGMNSHEKPDDSFRPDFLYDNSGRTSLYAPFSSFRSTMGLVDVSTFKNFDNFIRFAIDFRNSLKENIVDFFGPMKVKSR